MSEGFSSLHAGAVLDAQYSLVSLNPEMETMPWRCGRHGHVQIGVHLSATCPCDVRPRRVSIGSNQEEQHEHKPF